jgi:hypothetical protein
MANLPPIEFSNNRHVNNNRYNRVEPLITVDKLKATYLFGVTAYDENGNSISDETIQTFIDQAISVLEHDLDITVKPTFIEEHKDYFAQDYWDWGYMQLNRIPVIELLDLSVVYLRDQNTLETVLDIPQEWIRLEPETGIIRLVPNNRFPGRLQVDASGAFFPELFRRYSTVPDLWVARYIHGFKEGQIPALLNAAIGMLASIFYMNIAGDLIIGAGIAGTSISLDGLSQSIQTTASAENHGYSAKVKDYKRLLFGDNQNDKPNSIVEILRKFYKGQSINII